MVTNEIIVLLYSYKLTTLSLCYLYLFVSLRHYFLQWDGFQLDIRVQPWESVLIQPQEI